MKFPLSFYKLVMAAAVALPSMALADITPVAPQQDDTDGCYMIGTAAELYGFAEMANGTSEGFSGCAKLTENIVVNENVLATATGASNVNAETGEYTGDASGFDVWTPIGTIKNPYVGTFDGNGHTISGLYVNDGTKDNVGLFGYMGEGNYVVKVQNVGVEDSYIKGKGFVGGVVGYNNHGTISNAYSTGSVTAIGDYVGGVVGYNSGSISNVYSTGSVTATGKSSNYVGGVIGQNTGSISNVYSTGSVTVASGDRVGGLVGQNTGTISNVYSTGSVTVASGARVGGLVGQNTGTISNAYSTGSVTVTVRPSYVGGVAGNNGGSINNVYYIIEEGVTAIAGGTGTVTDVDGKTTVEFANGSVAKALHDWCEKDGEDCKEGGLNGSVWGQGLGRDAFPTLTGVIGPALTLHVYEGVEIDSVYTPDTDLPTPTREGYEFLGWYATSDFSGSAVTRIPSDATGALEFFAKWEAQGGSGCIEIASVEDLFSFAARVNGGDGEICGELTADICVNACGEGESVLNADGTLNGSSFTPWTPIGTSSAPFKGTFYGQGHTISGLYYSGATISYANAGLFGFVSGKVTIDGVGIVDSYIYGNNSIGAFVGNVGGSSTDGSSLTISNSFNAGSVGGLIGSIGGLVGGVSSSVVINNSYNAGSVKGSKSLSTSGLVGSLSESASASINNSYNAGSVTGKSEKLYDDLVCGTGEVAVTNSFYIGKSQFEGGGATKKTAEEFANGSVAKALHDWCEKETGSDKCKEGGLDGSVWGQDLRKENSLPEFIERLDYKLGSVTFFEKAGKIDSAYVDATSDLAVDFPNDVVVSGPIKFKRTFAGSGYSTIVLPFQPNCSGDDCIENSANVNFYAFSYYDFVNKDIYVSGVYQDGLVANVPYLVQAKGVTELVFKNGGKFNTAGGVHSVNLGDKGAGWTIYGTYAYKQWEEGDEGLGKTYGFAGAADNDPAIVGQFAKIGVGAYIYPMRAYLEYVAPAPAGRPAANGAVRAFAANTVASLPDEIDVVIVEKGETGTEIAGSDDASGEQTTRVIGTINTRTGEFKFANDRWFDLNGRYLGNKKPTQKGAYYNNGKKVIVK